jgi:peptidoglycan/xylan/chitin deacetylase (PgdA/CDA1 family)
MARAATAEALKTRTFLVDVLAWMLLAALAAAGSLAWRSWTHRTLLAPAPAAAGADPRLVVLAYDRVVSKEDGRHVDAEQFRGHLDALARHGFHAVTLAAVQRFLSDPGAALPAKSLLLTFDHGYLSSLDAVDPVLRERRWPAVMFLMTERQERRDPFFLYWPGLAGMLDSGVWEIGSHGHQGHNPVVVDAQGDEGAFFLRRAFLPAAGREETWVEFAARVREDHLRAKELIRERLGRGTLAYAPPLRDVAVTSLDPEVHRVYEDVVRELYPIAFIDDLFGANDRAVESHHLKRLRVSGRWQGEELAAFVERAIAAPALGVAADEEREHLWVPGTGSAQPLGPELLARGATRADLWRAGSQWTEDFVLEAEVTIEGGQFWVVQQAADLSEEWRWGGDETGTHLQRRRPAEGVETLASFAARVEPGRVHRLEVRRRGSGLWVVWDGQPVSDRPAWLPDRFRGNVGLVCWGRGAPAEFRVRRLRFGREPYRTRAVSGEPSEAEVQAAIDDAPSLSALSPLWLDVSPGALNERNLDRDLLSILSRRYGWEILPTARVAGPPGDRLRARVDRALARAREAGFAGLRVEWSAPPESSPSLDAVAVEFERLAARRGLRVVLVRSALPGDGRVADGGLEP